MGWEGHDKDLLETETSCPALRACLCHPNHLHSLQHDLGLWRANLSTLSSQPSHQQSFWSSSSSLWKEHTAIKVIC